MQGRTCQRCGVRVETNEPWFTCENCGSAWALVGHSNGCKGASYVEVRFSHKRVRCSLCGRPMKVKWKKVVKVAPDIDESRPIGSFSLQTDWVVRQGNMLRARPLWFTDGRAFGPTGAMRLKPAFALAGPAAGRAKGSILLDTRGIHFSVIREKDVISWVDVASLEVGPGRCRRRSTLTVQSFEGMPRTFEVCRHRPQFLEAKLAPVSAYVARATNSSTSVQSEGPRG